VSEPAISATALTRRFGQIRALRGVDLRLENGERLALFGLNGAGKTTLLRVLGLGLTPDSGSLAIDGYDSRREARRARARIGWLGHASLLYGDLSAHQNLAFWGRLHGADDVEKRADALLEELGLATYSDEPARILSRGLAQRLSLARALIHNPALLLLDEPFTGLDPLAADSLRKRLVERRPDAPSMIIATHRIDDGLALSDRWVLLSRGKISASGTSKGTDPASVADAYRAPRKAS